MLLLLVLLFTRIETSSSAYTALPANVLDALRFITLPDAGNAAHSRSGAPIVVVHSRSHTHTPLGG